MKSKTAFLEKKEMEDRKRTRNEVFFPSRFHFLKKQNGLRLGELHLIIAPKGAGKSSFVKTILSELILHTKVLVYLSEEKAEQYVESLNELFDKAVGGVDEKRKMFLNNLEVISELDLESNLKTEQSFFKSLSEKITETNSKVFFLDNFTTSWLSGQVQKEKLYYEVLNKMAKKLNIALVVVSHTAKTSNIKNGPFTGEDIRGSLSGAQLSSYTYTINRVDLDPVRSFVFVDKARGYSEADRKFYELIYDKKTMLFEKDIETKRENVIEAIKEFADIGRKKNKKF